MGHRCGLAQKFLISMKVLIIAAIAAILTGHSTIGGIVRGIKTLLLLPIPCCKVSRYFRNVKKGIRARSELGYERNHLVGVEVLHAHHCAADGQW
jgi:hypothetical protein